MTSCLNAIGVFGEIPCTLPTLNLPPIKPIRRLSVIRILYSFLFETGMSLRLISQLRYEAESSFIPINGISVVIVFPSRSRGTIETRSSNLNNFSPLCTLGREKFTR